MHTEFCLESPPLWKSEKGMEV